MTENSPPWRFTHANFSQLGTAHTLDTVVVCEFFVDEREIGVQ